MSGEFDDLASILSGPQMTSSTSASSSSSSTASSSHTGRSSRRGVSFAQQDDSASSTAGSTVTRSTRRSSRSSTTSRSVYGQRKRTRRKKKKAVRPLPDEFVEGAIDTFRKMRLVNEIIRKTQVFVTVEFRMLTWSYVNFSLRVPAQTPVSELVRHIYDKHGENILKLKVYLGKVSSSALVTNYKHSLAELGIGRPPYDWTVDDQPDIDLLPVVASSYPHLLGFDTLQDAQEARRIRLDKLQRQREAADLATLEAQIDQEFDDEDEEEDDEEDAEHVLLDDDELERRQEEREQARLERRQQRLAQMQQQLEEDREAEKAKERAKQAKLSGGEYVMPTIAPRVLEIVCPLYYDFDVLEVKSDPLLSFDIAVHPSQPSVDSSFGHVDQLRDSLEKAGVLSSGAGNHDGQQQHTDSENEAANTNTGTDTDTGSQTGAAGTGVDGTTLDPGWGTPGSGMSSAASSRRSSSVSLTSATTTDLEHVET